MPRPIDDDSTVKLNRRPTKPVRRVPPWAVAMPALLVVLAIVGGWLLWASHRPPLPEGPHPLALRSMRVEPADNGQNRSDQPTTVPVPVGEPPVARAPPDATEPVRQGFRIETATEQRVLDHVPTEAADGLTVFRFAPNPRILVLDFASLRDQGQMLNRAAALVEKNGLPHDRLLDDAGLAAAVRASGDTVETFYYGHDYGTASLVRFFALADRDNVALTVQEETLAQLIRQEGWFEPNARLGLISIPQVGADGQVTRAVRATILHHELSHGEYFTNPDYAAFVHHFWLQMLTRAEREQIRDHLRSLGYDPALDGLMENEAQAYLMFTENPAFFTPEMIHMGAARLNELRTGFYRAMPSGWLRDSLGLSLAALRATGPRP